MITSVISSCHTPLCGSCGSWGLAEAVIADVSVRARLLHTEHHLLVPPRERRFRPLPCASPSFRADRPPPSQGPRTSGGPRRGTATGQPPRRTSCSRPCCRVRRAHRSRCCLRAVPRLFPRHDGLHGCQGVRVHGVHRLVIRRPLGLLAVGAGAGAGTACRNRAQQGDGRGHPQCGARTHAVSEPVGGGWLFADPSKRARSFASANAGAVIGAYPPTIAPQGNGRRRVWLRSCQRLTAWISWTTTCWSVAANAAATGRARRFTVSPVGAKGRSRKRRFHVAEGSAGAWTLVC